MHEIKKILHVSVTHFKLYVILMFKGFRKMFTNCCYALEITREPFNVYFKDNERKNMTI